MDHSKLKSDKDKEERMALSLFNDNDNLIIIFTIISKVELHPLPFQFNLHDDLTHNIITYTNDHY